MAFQEAVDKIGPGSKERIDQDVKIEEELFALAEDKITRNRGDDRAFMKTSIDVFEALREYS